LLFALPGEECDGFGELVEVCGFLFIIIPHSTDAPANG